MRAVVAIDPGRSGAIVLAGDDGTVTVLHKMPPTPRDVWECLEACKTILHAKNCQVVAVIEDVQPGGLTGDKAAKGQRMGSKSAFVFGRSVGELHMALAGLGFKVLLVRPQVWKQATRCQTPKGSVPAGKKDYTVVRRRVQETYPGVECFNWSADVLMIAQYGLQEIAAGRL